jgi:two-component system response regulator HydG
VQSAPRSKILVVDDSVEMGRLVAERLVAAGHACDFVSSGTDALALCRKDLFDVVITDHRMETVDGFDVLAAVRAMSPSTKVLIMTAFGNVESAVEAMRRGAYHYITKPFQFSDLLMFVERALEDRRLREENESLRRVALERTGSGAMIGRSAAMQSLFVLIERVAFSEAPVLIRGESGSGKELVARGLHFHGERRAGPFVPVNCTAMPEQLLESELFGHVKGAFTGATLARRGLFLEADQGTLFLDEIGDMAPPLQAKLLRVLEDGEVRAVGADSSRKVNVRIVAASHQDLEAKVAAGSFRTDLFYRLKVLPIRVPPLRDRVQDIPLLAEHFLADARKRSPNARLQWISPALMAAFMKHTWPGNVRELRHLIERMVVVLPCETAQLQDLLDIDAEFFAGPSPQETSRTRVIPLRQLEEEYIEWAISYCGGNKTRAAELLGIDKSTIHRRERK